MKTFSELTEHLKKDYNLPVDPNQMQDLHNIGYFHGFKGYRFVRESNNYIDFSNFGQIVALNNFDMQLKGLFYPRLMFIETALKNYVLEVVVEYCKSEKLQDIYKTGLTHYKSLKAGSNDYKKEFKRRMDLEMKISNDLTRDYMAGRNIEVHYFNQDKEIPIWGAFESLTLGEFGTFFGCCNKDIRLEVSKNLNLPTKYDENGFLLKGMIFTIKDLRNAIAHNGVIFDTRFASAGVDNRIKLLLAEELKLKTIDFNFISAYVALTVYLLKALGQKKNCKSFINGYDKLHEMLINMPENANMKIFGSQDKAVIQALLEYIEK